MSIFTDKNKEPEEDLSSSDIELDFKEEGGWLFKIKFICIYILIPLLGLGFIYCGGLSKLFTFGYENITNLLNSLQ